MTADMNMPQGLSQQSVHPSRKLKESIEAESKKLYQDHTVPVISASESSAVHDLEAEPSSSFCRVW